MTPDVVDASNADSPAQLFIELWLRASQWDPSKLLLSTVPQHVRSDVLQVLDSDDTPALMKILRSAVSGGDDVDSRGNLLALMLAIDDALIPIHPRSQRGGSRRIPPRRWVAAARDLRNASAHYAQREQFRLIARGPLSRNQRHPYSSFAESLRDRFAAIEVVPTEFALESRAVQVKHLVVAASVGKGVRPLSTRTAFGAERVTIVPIAERAEDFELTGRMHGPVWLIKYALCAHLTPAEKLVLGLSSAPPCDIGIAPEFVMTEDQADKIPGLLRGLATSPCRLVVSGTGLTRDDREGQHWNECQVFNGAGATLWRQRKLWPAASVGKTIKLFGLPTSHPGLGHEDTASGDEIVIADIDGVGRCCILICQDVTSTLATDVLKNFQPDWVFVPILDKWLDAGRWAHQHCFSLSHHAPTRFVVARNVGVLPSSLSSTVGEDHCVLAVGPAHKNDTTDVAGRRVRMDPALPGTAPAYASIDWENGDGWKTSILDARSEEEIRRP